MKGDEAHRIIKGNEIYDNWKRDVNKGKSSMEWSEEVAYEKEEGDQELVERGDLRHRREKRGMRSEENQGGNECEEDEARTPEDVSFNVVVRFDREGGVKQIDPLRLTKIIRELVGEVQYARVLGNGCLLIGCHTENQVERARNLQSVEKVRVTKTVRVGEPRSNGVKGVITGVPYSVSMKELIENLRVCNNTVKNTIRMTRGVERLDTETVLVEFDAKEIPRDLYCGLVRYKVREFVPQPMRCYKCQEYGHIAKVCTGKRRCTRCGGDHDYGKCAVGTKPKCCNCGGDHSVAYWGCEALKKEAAVQKIRIREKVSYAEAVRRFGQERDTVAKQGVRLQQVVTTLEQEFEKMMGEERKKLVTFIAGVINATVDVKSEAERIQIIVKAAAYHLDMEGVHWEKVRDELSVPAGEEPQCIW